MNSCVYAADECVLVSRDACWCQFLSRRRLTGNNVRIVFAA